MTIGRGVPALVACADLLYGAAAAVDRTSSDTTSEFHFRQGWKAKARCCSDSAVANREARGPEWNGGVRPGQARGPSRQRTLNNTGDGALMQYPPLLHECDMRWMKARIALFRSQTMSVMNHIIYDG